MINHYLLNIILIIFYYKVSTLAVSDNGSLIASSQVGSTHHKGYACPVFIWQLNDFSRLAILRGLTIKANLLSFSPDEKFLCGCDDVNYFYFIYDICILSKGPSTVYMGHY